MRLSYRIKTLLFPERCPYCGALIEAEEIACASCMAELRRKHQAILGGAGGCPCVSSFVYGGKVRRMLLRVKYRNRVQYIPQVAAIMADDIRHAYRTVRFDTVTAVPMHRRDLKARGYNQSELIARAISEKLSVPYLDTLQKVKQTPKQQHLTYSERRKNLRGAFALIDKETVSGKQILLIDDIITSGSTLSACCKVLNKAAPALICCATVASAARNYPDTTVI